MPASPRKRTTSVHEHQRRVRISKTNPTGITIVDRHLRRLKGTQLDPDEIVSVCKNYSRKDLIQPTAGKLSEYKKADHYDDLIAVWTDYFNKKFGGASPLDPDVIKALIASESGFRLDPKENKQAFGIAQITKSTWRILQDLEGEAKDFVFSKIRQKDLKDPNIAIPMAPRWIFRKQDLAKGKLGREPTTEEVILEYKGLLKSKSEYRDQALGAFREAYAKLKKK